MGGRSAVLVEHPQSGRQEVQCFQLLFDVSTVATQFQMHAKPHLIDEIQGLVKRLGHELGGPETRMERVHGMLRAE